MQDEEPSDDDLARFADETGFCPDCGEEIWDEAWQCPHCGVVVENRVRRERSDPIGRSVSKRTMAALVVGLILLFLLFQFR